MSRKNYIDDRSDPLNPTANIEIGGRTYRHSIADIPYERHEWYLSVIERQMQDIHDHAVNDTRQQIRDDFKRLLCL